MTPWIDEKETSVDAGVVRLLRDVEGPEAHDFADRLDEALSDIEHAIEDFRAAAREARDWLRAEADRAALLNAQEYLDDLDPDYPPDAALLALRDDGPKLVEAMQAQRRFDVVDQSVQDALDELDDRHGLIRWPL